MTRAHAMLRLLEHGPLTYRQAVEITGWPPRAVQHALATLMRDDLVRPIAIGHRRGYCLWATE